MFRTRSRITKGAPSLDRSAVSRGNELSADDFVSVRAYDRLCRGRAGVIILSAPPGYGKTTLLRAFSREIEAGGGVVAWCPMDRVVAGVQTVDHVDVIFIDDAHDADPRKFSRLIRTITSSDAGQRFVIATRTLPDMDWIALASRGRVEILDVEALTLDEDEVGTVLAHYAGCKPSPEQTRKVSAWIEGWPIAAQCYGMLARRRDGWSKVNILETSPRENLGQYLNESIYNELDDAMRRFLFDLSDLGRFSSAMLREVIDPSAELLLARARLENVMIVPALNGGEWLRLHGIFQQFLEAKKRQAGTTRRIDILRSASEWCERRGALCDAVDYALDAGDFDRAHQLLTDNAARIAHTLGELPRMLVWTARLERAGEPISVPLRLWKIWALVLAQQIEPACSELDILDGEMPSDAPLSWLVHRDKLRVSIAARQDDLPRVIELADAWMERWEYLDPFHTAAVRVLRALAHLQLGDRHMARRDLLVARQRASEAGGIYGRTWVAKAEAYIELQSGRASQAREIILSALGNVHAVDEIAGSTVGTVHLLAARILVETGEGRLAREHLAAGHLHLGDNGLIETHVAALEAATLLAEDADGIDAALCETQHRVVQGVRYAVKADLLAINLQLRHGRVTDAADGFQAAFVSKPGGWLHVATGLAVPHCMSHDVDQTRAWVAFGEDHVSEASALAAQLLPMAEMAGRARDHVALLLLSATCSLREGKSANAKRSLERALRLASERGFRRTVIDNAWGLTALLGDTEVFSAGSGAAAELLEALRHRYGINLEAGDGHAPVDRLTSREQEILSLLDTGLTSQSIADHIDVGLSTTKWHIQNIYTKLGVRNRTGALARARRLALL